MLMRAASIIVLAIALSSCGGGSDNPTTPPPPNDTNYPPGSPPGGSPMGNTSTITVSDNRFDPSALTVPVGTTVTWTFGGYAAHNVTFDNGVSSGDKTSGSYERTFAQAGSYPYHCTIHGTSMSGTITVQ